MTVSPLSDQSLDQLFLEAHTAYAWLAKPVPETLLHRLADTLKMGPTSLNSSPARIVFVVSSEEKEKLRPCLAPTNVEKTMSAPAIAIVGYDLAFYEKLPHLFPHMDAKAMFVGKEAAAQETAFRNSSLQGAYLILAARALGLDCGPMSGFDAAAVEQAFFPPGTLGSGTIKANFLCNLGYGNPEGFRPRGPRLAFDEFCKIV